MKIKNVKIQDNENVVPECKIKKMIKMQYDKVPLVQMENPDVVGCEDVLRCTCAI